MQILAAISLFCCVGILWAAISVARRMRAGRPRHVSGIPQPGSQPDFKQHLLAASDVTFESHERQPAFTSSPNVQAGSRNATRNQSVHELAAKKIWTIPPRTLRTLPRSRYGLPPLKRSADNLPRKAPQSVRPAGTGELNPPGFHKDPSGMVDIYSSPSPTIKGRERSPDRGQI